MVLRRAPLGSSRAGVVAAWILGAFLVAVTACSPDAQQETARPASTRPPAVVRTVTLPDLARADESVREQLRERFAALEALRASSTATDAEKAAAFGSVAVLLHAAEFYEAAEPAYEHARALAPRHPKWPYLLAHLHKSRGEPAKAMAGFTRVVELSPRDPAALIWLGRMYLDQGEAGKAEPLFERARAVAPDSVAALLGLGQAALARRDFSKAAGVLEEALRVSPSAASVHSPLAMVYRGLGDTAKAEAHLRQWRNTEVAVPDPVRDELDLALQSSLSFEIRGVRALQARDYPSAVQFFTQGVAMSDGTTMLGRSLRHKLGTALYMTGDLPGAVARFRETVRLAPDGGLDDATAKAHYSLGVLMATAGLGKQAIEHLAAAVRYDPDYVEGQVALGDALRRAGRVEASLPHYERAIALNPRAVAPRLSYGMALVRLRRYADARRYFEEASAAHADTPDLRHALARLLVAAPDDAVRDGSRGIGIVRALMSEGARTTALGETFAMALAETGDFTQAVTVQQGIRAAATRAGLSADAARMSRNLARYEQRRPCREPWATDDPIHSPGPPLDPSLRPILLANSRD